MLLLPPPFFPWPAFGTGGEGERAKRAREMELPWQENNNQSKVCTNDAPVRGCPTPKEEGTKEREREREKGGNDYFYKKPEHTHRKKKRKGAKQSNPM